MANLKDSFTCFIDGLLNCPGQQAQPLVAIGKISFTGEGLWGSKSHPPPLKCSNAMCKNNEEHTATKGKSKEQ